MMSRICSCVVVLLLTGAHLYAQDTPTTGGAGLDKVTRRGQKEATGKISSANKTEVVFKPTGKPEEKIPANEVERIDWQAEPPEAKLAKTQESNGKFDSAIELFTTALNKAAAAEIKADITFQIARTAGKQALTDSSKLDDAIKKLEAAQKASPDHYAYYSSLSLLGRLYKQKKDFPKAAALFEQLGKAPWKDYQMQSKVAAASILEADGKLDDAATAYDAVLSETPSTPAEETQKQTASLGKARVLVAKKQPDEALKLLQDVFDKTAPEETAVLAEAYLRQGDCYREQDKTQDALLAYLHVDVLFAAEGAYHAEALYQLAKLWEKDGKRPRAEEARDKLAQLYPASEWAQQTKAPAGG